MLLIINYFTSGLDDATDAVPKATDHQEEPGKIAALETFSVKSGLSSHTSDRLSKKSADPLAAYASTLHQKDSSDKASVVSAASRTSTLRKEATSNSVASADLEKPLSRKSSIESASRSLRSQKTAQNSVLTRKSSVESLEKPRLSRKSSGDLTSEGRAPVSRQSSEESVGKQNSRTSAGVATLRPNNNSTLPQGSDEGEDLESNVDFGKTTLFGKTRDLGLTYKALSQASDEDDVYSDNFSDQPYNDDDDF